MQSLRLSYWNVNVTTVKQLFRQRCGAVRSGAVRCGSVRCGSVQFGSVQFGAVRSGAVRCGVVPALPNGCLVPPIVPRQIFVRRYQRFGTKDPVLVSAAGLQSWYTPVET